MSTFKDIQAEGDAVLPKLLTAPLDEDLNCKREAGRAKLVNRNSLVAYSWNSSVRRLQQEGVKSEAGVSYTGRLCLLNLVETGFLFLSSGPWNTIIYFMQICVILGGIFEPS